MSTPPSFGTRGLGRPPAPPPPRRFRSQAVVITAVGALLLGGAGADEWRRERCKPPGPDETRERPGWCDDVSSSHGSGGHSYGGGGSTGHGFASTTSHASFGGFGESGAGHGSGS